MEHLRYAALRERRVALVTGGANGIGAGVRDTSAGRERGDAAGSGLGECTQPGSKRERRHPVWDASVQVLLVSSLALPRV